MKRLLKFIQWASAVAGVILASFLVVNAFDEDLEPGALAIIHAQPKIKPEKNAYFYLIGLSAPQGREPSEFGQQCMARLSEVPNGPKATLQWLTGNDRDCAKYEDTLRRKGSTIACEQQEFCLAHYQKHSAAIKHLAEIHKTALQRYTHLLTMEGYEEIPYINHLTTTLSLDLTNELYAAVSASKLLEGDTEAFIRRTAAEAKFYRMVLRGDSSFLSKLLALVGANRAARLASDAVSANPSLAKKYYEILLSISLPLTAAERSLESVVTGDIKQDASTLAYDADEMDTGLHDKFLSRFIFKYHATINFKYRDLQGWRELSQLPTEKYLAAEKAALAKLTGPWRENYVHMIYNPMGKLLAGLNSANYADYPRRMIDSDGRLRLVSLQIQIAAQKIPEVEIPAFLQNADPRFRDPYTGLPMQWDKTRGLHFRGYAKGALAQDGVVSLKL